MKIKVGATGNWTTFLSTFSLDGLKDTLGF